MRIALLALALCACPALADEPLDGTWTGTITIVGTRLQSSYSPITGVTVIPVPDLQIMPSPFGPLILSPDGTYAMPALDYGGNWAADPAMVTFTGPLASSPAGIEWLQSGPVLTLTLQDPTIQDGQQVTFSRTGPSAP